jgi:hypothetical protein
VLRPWFGPDVMQRDRELATRAEAARRRRQRPAEETAAARTGEQVIAEAEAILRSSEANGLGVCCDEVAGAARPSRSRWGPQGEEVSAILVADEGRAHGCNEAGCGRSG